MIITHRLEFENCRARSGNRKAAGVDIAAPEYPKGANIFHRERQARKRFMIPLNYASVYPVLRRAQIFSLKILNVFKWLKLMPT